LSHPIFKNSGENSQLLKMNIVRRIEGEKAAAFDPIPTTTEEVSTTTTTTTTTTALAPFGGCQPNTASVLAVTNIPYQETTVQQEFNALTSKVCVEILKTENRKY
jgi:hypothetical protein